MIQEESIYKENKRSENKVLQCVIFKILRKKVKIVKILGGKLSDVGYEKLENGVNKGEWLIILNVVEKLIMIRVEIRLKFLVSYSVVMIYLRNNFKVEKWDEMWIEKNLR